MAKSQLVKRLSYMPNMIIFLSHAYFRNLLSQIHLFTFALTYLNIFTDHYRNRDKPRK